MEDNLVGVADVIEAIKTEIRAAQEVVIGDPKLELAGVDLEIKSLITKSAKGEVKAEIPAVSPTGSFGGNIKEDQLQKLHLSLEPPEPELLKESSTDLRKLNIASAIVALRRELQKGLSGKPRLLPKKLDIEVSFGVQRSAGGGAGINLVFLKIGGSGEYISECAHKVILHFVAPRLPRP